MDTSARYESSAGELSSPPSGPLSEPGSPSGRAAAARAPDLKSGGETAKNEDPRHSHDGVPQYEQIQTVQSGGTGPPKRYGLIDGAWVQLTAAGLPRKKPGRKPGMGSNVKSARPSDGPEGPGSGQEHSKVRKPRKPRDPNVPTQPRKRKIAPAGSENAPESAGPSPKIFALATPGPSSSHSSPQHRTSMPLHQHQNHAPLESNYSPKMPSRESYPGSMQSILNADPPARPQSTSNGGPMPVRTVGQSYDPIRDGVRDTMLSNKPLASNAGSPRAPSQVANRSPSIASIIDPAPSVLRSPNNSHNTYQASSTQSRLQGQESPMPASPSQPAKPVSTQTQTSRPGLQELKKDQPPAPPPIPRPVIKESNFTTIANGPVRKVSPKQKPQTGVSTPKTDHLDDLPQEGEGRSILDFGRAKPGEEAQAPTIVLNIPIKAGETNRYVNFMRLAEDRYGWDALHPRLAANRDRKARIAAATASLEKIESGRESGDEMSLDLSDGEGSNLDNGGTSGAEALAKPKKKRNFKEDNYDVDDDFVDDSELLWEAQAAASRDGFFVYSGPLVPEVEEPPAGHEGPAKRGRGGGRGSRGGRGGSSRGTTSGRGGGPGSRGGSVARKPRISKSERAQREREKAEREGMGQTDKSKSDYALQPTTPSLAMKVLDT